MSDKHIVLSVLLFQAEGAWIAQALEHDISASGPDIEHAKLAFERTVGGYLTLAERHGVEPLANLKAAPLQFWSIWNRLAQETLPAERMLSIPAFMMPVVTYDPIPA